MPNLLPVFEVLQIRLQALVAQGGGSLQKNEPPEKSLKKLAETLTGVRYICTVLFPRANTACQSRIPALRLIFQYFSMISGENKDHATRPASPAKQPLDPGIASTNPTACHGRPRPGSDFQWLPGTRQNFTGRVFPAWPISRVAGNRPRQWSDHTGFNNRPTGSSTGRDHHDHGSGKTIFPTCRSCPGNGPRQLVNYPGSFPPGSLLGPGPGITLPGDCCRVGFFKTCRTTRLSSSATGR